jgi:hypothetical protein
MPKIREVFDSKITQHDKFHRCGVKFVAQKSQRNPAKYRRVFLGPQGVAKRRQIESNWRFVLM